MEIGGIGYKELENTILDLVTGLLSGSWAAVLLMGQMTIVARTPVHTAMLRSEEHAWLTVATQVCLRCRLFCSRCSLKAWYHWYLTNRNLEDDFIIGGCWRIGSHQAPRRARNPNNRGASLTFLQEESSKGSSQRLSCLLSFLS
eukprot:symbB.v1.2.014631.t1/scaffold1040.1/size142515/7